jgi:predicted TIM-barrel fold metal-dependent hydrolase
LNGEALPFAEIPLIDGHLHPPLLDAAASTSSGYVRFFSEAADEESLARHAPHSLFFHRAVAELAGLLGCAPDPEAVVAARSALGLPALLRLLVHDAGVEALLIDDGYPPAGAMAVEAVGDAAGCTAGRVLRIETLAESLFHEAGSARDLADRLMRALMAVPRPLALKTIVAYRSGLQVAEPAADTVTRAFEGVRAASAFERPRLTAKPLLDFLLLRALEWAVERRLPVQVHTGYGDRDLDLTLANPALLRPVLEQPRFASLQVVLLHAAYPYSREAAYLAAVYPHVYVDFSQANPMLGERQLARVLEELLALAPPTKLLYGSDAWGIPDWIWLGARTGRRALAAALDGVPDRDAIARRILRDNARALYGL